MPYPYRDREPDPVLTKAIAAEALSHGVVLLTCGIGVLAAVVRGLTR